MKKSDARNHARIAEKLAERIKTETAGLDCANGETEICFNNLLYVCNYELSRVFNDAQTDYDCEPDDRSQTYVSIIEGHIFDIDGNEVDDKFDFTAIQGYFYFDHTIDFD